MLGWKTEELKIAILNLTAPEMTIISILAFWGGGRGKWDLLTVVIKMHIKFTILTILSKYFKHNCFKINILNTITILSEQFSGVN